MLTELETRVAQFCGLSAETERVLDYVSIERKRQEQLRESGKFSHTAATPGGSDYSALAMLTEELGEVARELCEDATKPVEGQKRLREELIQVAAIAVAWVERLDREASQRG